MVSYLEWASKEVTPLFRIPETRHAPSGKAPRWKIATWTLLFSAIGVLLATTLATLHDLIGLIM